MLQNNLYQREGHLFSGRARHAPCVDDAAAEQTLFFGLTNTLKDGLTSNPNQNPFFSTYENLAYEKPLRYWFIDWAAYWAKGRDENKRLRNFVKEFTNIKSVPFYFTLSNNRNRLTWPILWPYLDKRRWIDATRRDTAC